MSPRLTRTQNEPRRGMIPTVAEARRPGGTPWVSRASHRNGDGRHGEGPRRLRNVYDGDDSDVERATTAKNKNEGGDVVLMAGMVMIWSIAGAIDSSR